MHEWNVPVEVHRGRHDDYCGTVTFVVLISEGINSILPGRWRCRVVVSTWIIYRWRCRVVVSTCGSYIERRRGEDRVSAIFMTILTGIHRVITRARARARVRVRVRHDRCLPGQPHLF